MIRRAMTTVLVMLVITAIACGGAVQGPYLAGSWYPSDAKLLAEMLDGFLAMAGKSPLLDEKPVAIICPHAGYRYSGQVAAYSYREVKGRDYESVIVVSSAHQYLGRGAALISKGKIGTPLGAIAIDVDLAGRLLANEDIRELPAAFVDDNSVELQMPYIKRVLPKAKVVPLVIGPFYRDYRALGESLYQAARERNVLLIASTDMAHRPEAAIAEDVDARTLEAIKSMDAARIVANEKEQMMRGLARLQCALCGLEAVASVMHAARRLGADSLEVLDYSHSGVSSGDNSQVVGYCAVALYAAKKGGSKMSDYILDEKEQRKLLGLARQTIDLYLREEKRPKANYREPRLTRHAGAFVTLHEQGRLRGCIGYIEPVKPLYEAIIDMAINAATRDHRFPRVQHKELDGIEIEISVLSPKKKINDPEQEIKLGEHGVIIEKDGRGGVFLPQVATETGWDLERFMAELCSQKAGLAADAWKKGGCDIYVFTAQVFHE